MVPVTEIRPSVPFEEQETHAYIDYIENAGHVYSNHKPTIKMLHRYAEEYPDEVIIEIENDYGCQVSVPMKWIRIQPPRRQSEETKAKAAANLLAIRQNKKSED